MQQGLPRRLRHFVSLFPRLAGRGKVGYPKSIAGWSAKRWRLVAYLVVFACPDLPSAARCRPRDRSARDPRWVRRAPVPGNTHFSRHLRQCWWCEPEHLRRGIIDSLTFGPATRCGNPAGMKFAVSFLGCSGDVIPDLTQWASRGSSAGTNKPSFFHQELSSSPNQSVGYGTTAFGCAVFVHKVSHSRFRNAARWLAEI